MDSEKVCSKVNHAENDRKFYMKAMAVPRNIVEPSICCSRIGVFISHCSAELAGVEMIDARMEGR